MDGIYSFIGFINEGNKLGYIILFIEVIAILYLMSKKEEKESYLLLKLIGYLLLGCFNVNIQIGYIPIIIPVGFFIVLNLLKSEKSKNKSIKKKISILALFIFVFNVVNNSIYQIVEQRSREITVTNLNMNTLSDEYENIKKELKISKDSVLEHIRLSYDNEDNISELIFAINDFAKNKYYFLTLEKEKLNVDASFRNQYEYDTYYDEINISMEKFLKLISKLNKYENANRYTIDYKYEGDYNYSDEYSKVDIYSLDVHNYSIKKLHPKSIIYNIVGINQLVFKEDGMLNNIYMTEYDLDEYSMYEDVNFIIENIKTNNKVEVNQIEDVSYIGELLNHDFWTESTLDIDIDPNLFIEDNKGNKFALSSENKSFIRRDLEGVNVWYIASQNIYDEINLYTIKSDLSEEDVNKIRENIK